MSGQRRNIGDARFLETSFLRRPFSAQGRGGVRTHRCLGSCRLCHHPLFDCGFSCTLCRGWGYTFLPYRGKRFRRGSGTLGYCRIVPDRDAVCSTGSLWIAWFSRGGRILTRGMLVRGFSRRVLGHRMLCRAGIGILRSRTYPRLCRFSRILMSRTECRILRCDRPPRCGFFSHRRLHRRRGLSGGLTRCGQLIRLSGWIYPCAWLSGRLRVSVCLGRRFSFPAQTLLVRPIDPLPQGIPGISFRHIELSGIAKWLFLISRTVRLPSVAA